MINRYTFFGDVAFYMLNGHSKKETEPWFEIKSRKLILQSCIVNQLRSSEIRLRLNSSKKKICYMKLEFNLFIKRFELFDSLTIEYRTISMHRIKLYNNNMFNCMFVLFSINKLRIQLT